MTDQDHRHRNIAAITEYLSAGGVPTISVETPEWGDDYATFKLGVPAHVPNELRDSDPIRDAFIAGFMASSEGGNGEVAPRGTTPADLAHTKYDGWDGDTDD